MRSLSKLVATLVLAGVAGACVISVDSVVTAPEAAFDARLLGTWRGGSDSGDVVRITRDSAGPHTYDIAYTDDGKTGEFEGRLGRLGSRTVLDVWPVPRDTDIAEQYRGLLIPGHTILVIDIGVDQMVTATLNADTLRKAIRTGQLRLDTLAYHRQMVLTNGHSHLRDALSTYIARKGALDKGETWRRVRR